MQLRYLNPLSLAFYPMLRRVFVSRQKKVLLGSVPNLAEEICISCPGPALSTTAECVLGAGQSSPQPGVQTGTKGS